MSQNIAIYKQLMDSIKKKIIAGELKIGDKLDSERAMSDQYGINRMTVRNALKKLEKEGILVSYRGKGTFVNEIPEIEDKVELGNNEILSLSMQIRQKGMKSTRQTLSLKKVKAEGELKDYFPNSTMVYEIIRLLLINDSPYALQKAYIPCHLFKDAERFDFEEFSLYDYMHDQGHRPKTMISYLKIESLPKEYLDIMNLDAKKKVFLFDYFGFDENRELVEYTISYHHPEYTSFKYITSVNR